MMGYAILFLIHEHDTSFVREEFAMFSSSAPRFPSSNNLTGWLKISS